jgi:hypothetical protein
MVSTYRHVRLARISVGILILAIIVWGLTDVRRRARIDPQNPSVHRTDFTVYTEAGAAMFDGRDPYCVTNVRGWKYVYPPLFAIVVAPLHAFDPQIQVLIWFAISICMGWGCYHECAQIASIVSPGVPSKGVFGTIPSWIGFAALLAAALPVLNCLQRGQVGVTLLYFLLLGFRLLAGAHSMRRSMLAGAVFALPIVLKATPLLPVAFILTQRMIAACYSPRPGLELARCGGSCSGTVCGLVMLLFVVPAAVTGWHGNLHQLSTWWNDVAMHEENALDERFAGDNTTDRNQSLTNATHHFGNWLLGYLQVGRVTDEQKRPVHGARALLGNTRIINLLLVAVRGAVVVLLFLLGYRMARAQDWLGQTAAFSLAYLATLIICQIARAHYFMIWFPAVTFVCTWLIRAGRPYWAVLYAILPGVLTVSHYAFLHTAGGTGLLGLGTGFWFTSVCFTMLRICPVEKSAATLGSNAREYRSHIEATNDEALCDAA